MMKFNLLDEIGGVDTSDISRPISFYEIMAVSRGIYDRIEIFSSTSEREMLQIVRRTSNYGMGTTTTAGKIFIGGSKKDTIIIGEKQDTTGPELEGAIPLVTRAALNAGRKAIENKWRGESKRAAKPSERFNTRLGGLTNAAIFASGLVMVSEEDTEDILLGWRDEAVGYIDSLISSDSSNHDQIGNEYTKFVDRIIWALNSQLKTD